MPDLNIRNINSALLRDVNVAAAKADLTQRDYVIQVLTRAIGALEKENEQTEPNQRKVTPPIDMGGIGEDSVPRVATCPGCEVRLVEVRGKRGCPECGKEVPRGREKWI